MTVFLVPVGGGRYTLYCELKESEAEPSDPSRPHSPSWLGRLRRRWREWRERTLQRFRTTVADAEAQQEREELGEEAPAKRGFGRFVLRRIAEAVAEQRLLWHLRRASAGRLVHPDDVPPARARRLARDEFTRDHRKHLVRALVNGAVSVVLGIVFFFVPGPNLVAYYFLFLAIGHAFALRGARKGLALDWSTEASAPLRSVGDALGLDQASRRAELERLTADLGLERLWRFLERVARRPA